MKNIQTAMKNLNKAAGAKTNIFAGHDMKLLEVKGILRTLADQRGQAIATPKRLHELIKYLGNTKVKGGKK